MTDRLTPQQLRARIAPFLAAVPVNSVWQHRKGTRYSVLTVALSSDDLSPVVVYIDIGHTAPIFTRPFDEFTDGRFTRLHIEAPARA